jgi:hypothetical protein
MFHVRAGLAAVLFAASATSALAAKSAALDCSKMTIPDTPVKGVVGEQPFVPNAVTIHATPRGMVINENSFDRYELSLQSDGIFNAATVSFLVRTGTHPDGHVFRALPTDSISAQPAAAPGTPEIQGWDLQLEAANVDTSFTQAVASIRLEIGKQTGDTIPGRIFFCVPDVQATIRGVFNARVIP